MNTKRVLVTGASGFIGQALVAQLWRDGCNVHAQQRAHANSTTGCFEADLAELAGAKHLADAPAWRDAIETTDYCIHLAGIAHRSGDTPASDYEKLNHQASAGLARLAAQAGHRRLILISSVNAMGDQSGTSPLTPQTTPQPCDPYGRSKLAAEKSALTIAAATDMELVIVRPPLVYGPGAKGNLLRILRLVNSRWPVPAILPETVPPNLRSMIGLENLVALLGRALDHPGLAGRTILPADARYSTATLIAQIARHMHRRTLVRLPVPAGFLTALGMLTGRQAFTRRLTSNLLVQDDWLDAQPELAMPLASEQIISAMVNHYLASPVSGRLS